MEVRIHDEIHTGARSIFEDLEKCLIHFFKVFSAIDILDFRRECIPSFFGFDVMRFRPNDISFKATRFQDVTGDSEIVYITAETVSYLSVVDIAGILLFQRYSL